VAIPPADFVLHNSLFLIDHFHNVIIGGVVFGTMAGITYWFPKAFGFRLNERLGKLGFLVLVHRLLPGLHAALCAGTYGCDSADATLPGDALATADGGGPRRCRRDSARDRTGDPWNARTLEWSIPSPPPAWNFTQLPNVQGTDAHWQMKEQGAASVMSHM
jgi:cytochrome o ubiquinol oxidase subunit I